MKRVMTLAAAFALLAAGCSDSTTESSDSTGGEQEATSGKDVFATGGYKADCYDCDPEGDSAVIQLGVAERFWKPGDFWQVAYQLKTDRRVERQALGLVQSKVDVGLVVLNFEVTDTGTTTVGDVERKTATIRITQGDANGQLADLFDQFSTENVRIDENTQKIELVIDDLLRPVSVTEFNRSYPNGKTFQADPAQVLRGIGSDFPYVVPNAYLGANKTSLPALPTAIEAIATATKSGYQGREYFLFDMGTQGNAGELVYWAAGDPWPYYVETPYAAGVLVNSNFN